MARFSIPWEKSPLLQRAILSSRSYDSELRPPHVLEELIEILRYRDLIVQLVRRDIVTRYKRSVLGVAWTMLNPLGTMVVMTLVFSQIFSSVAAYPAYLLSGLVAWNFFGQTTVYAMRQLIWGSTLIHRIYIPKTLFAIAAVGTGGVNLLLSLIPLAVVILLTGVWLQPAVLFLPLSILLLAIFTLGIGLLLSTFAAAFTDVVEMYDIVSLAWMYLTPIFYPPDIIPASVRPFVLNLNPMYSLIKLFRLSLYYGQAPGWDQVLTAAAWAFLTLAVGWAVFTWKADEFAYRV